MERKDFEHGPNRHVELHTTNDEAELIIAALVVYRNSIENWTLLHTGTTHGTYTITDRTHGPSTYSVEKLIEAVQTRNVVDGPEARDR